MKLSVQNLQQIMQLLRNVAEVDANDSIANAASDLAFRLESAGTSVFDMPMDYTKWTPVDQATVEYAVAKRNRYIFKPGARHAVDIQKENV